MTQRVDCQICGARSAVLDSAKPSFMTERSARLVEGKGFWMYCSDCSYAMEELNKRRKAHRLQPIEMDEALK